MEGPYISASKTPTLHPIWANVTAKFAVTVDFPTPPFPEEIAIIFSIPDILFPLIKFGLEATSGVTTLMFILILAFS